MMTSSVPTARARSYLAAIVLWVGIPVLAQAAQNPADELSPAVMQAPMPANHEMPVTPLSDPMAVASMDPAQPGKRMGSMAKMKAREEMLKRSPPAPANSTLPAFAGVLHLYHVGATGFFLNLSPRIALTADQQGELTHLKAQALLLQSASDRKIEAGEQELWLLTAANSPIAEKITAKVREIEKARGDKRIAFIEAVGEAAKVLTSQQQAQLLDSAPVAVAAPMPAKDASSALTAVPLKGSSTP